MLSEQGSCVLFEEAADGIEDARIRIASKVGLSGLLSHNDSYTTYDPGDTHMSNVTAASRTILRRIVTEGKHFEGKVTSLLQKDKDALVDLLSEAIPDIDWADLSQDEAEEIHQEMAGAKAESKPTRRKRASASDETAEEEAPAKTTRRRRSKAAEPEEEAEEEAKPARARRGSRARKAEDEAEEAPAKTTRRRRSSKAAETETAEEEAPAKPARTRRGRGKAAATEEEEAPAKPARRGRGKAASKKASDDAPETESVNAAPVDLAPIIERLDAIGKSMLDAKDLKAVTAATTELGARLDSLSASVDGLLYVMWEQNYDEDFKEFEDFKKEYCQG